MKRISIYKMIERRVEWGEWVLVVGGESLFTRGEKRERICKVDRYNLSSVDKKHAHQVSR